MDGYPPYANLVYDVGTLSWVRMTQPLVDSLTSYIYLAVDGVEGQLSTISNQLTTISGYTDGIEGLLTSIKTQGDTQLDGPPRDAFSRLRVSDAVTLFDSSFEYGLDEDQMAVSTASGATATASTTSGVVTLNVSTTSGSTAIMQSRQYMRYQPGKSQMIVLTGLIGAAASGVTKRFGYFDDLNGIFLEQQGTSGLYWVRRDSTSGSVVDNAVAQDDWNIDPLDGTGPSGITLDVNDTQIVFIDLQWLGVGRVRCGFDIGGVVVYAHEFLNANNGQVRPYMKTANLPVRWWIQNGDGGSGGSIGAICCTAISEGGFEDARGETFAASATTGRTVASRRALLSIRPKATLAGLINRSQILPQDLSVVATGTNIITLIELVYNPTFTGTPTWTSSSAESSVEYSVHGDAATGAFTGGTVVDAFLLAGTTNQRSATLTQIATRAPLALDIAGANPRALSIVGTDVSGTATCYATMTWRETR